MNDTYELKSGNILQIIPDESGESPREWDNVGIMAAFHKRYTLGDKNLNFSDKDFDGWEEMGDHIIKNEDAIAILGLYLYDHGGITMSTGSFSDRWDSGQVGFIYTTQEILTKNGISQGTSDGLLDDESEVDYTKRVTDYLESEVKTYSQYLEGDIYGFKVIKREKCDLGEEHEIELDSCWGFYGSDPKTNGMMDHINEELLN